MIITGSVTVKHRGYTVEFEREDDHWYGKIIGIKDLITVIADRFATMEQEAKAAIDDYIDTCAELGVEPNEPEAEQ